MIFQRINKESFPEIYANPICSKILSLIGTGMNEGIHVEDLSRATELDNRTARKAIEEIRRAGVVICMDCKHGYYFPESIEELRLYVQQEERRGRSTFYTLKTARLLYKRLSGG